VNHHEIAFRYPVTLYRQQAQNQINMKMKTYISLALAMSLMAMQSTAQQNYRQTGSPVFNIAGTSTMHDWTMVSSTATYNATLEVNAEGVLTKLNGVTVTLPAESLKSKEKAMDKNAYKSLNTDKYKEIIFHLTSSKINKNIITCSGNLTISGTTKPVDVDVTYEARNGSFNFKGSKKIKMTDFKVEPPSFMFGTIKTGDEITITFDATLAPQASNKVLSQK
jgi:polyisoprenoid-binding protein YceI